jgi:hypothetical protein
MTRTSRAFVWLAGACLAAACSSPTSSTQLNVDLTATPDPTTAVASQGVTYTITGDSTHADQIRTYPWETSFVVNLQETAGTAMEITSVNLKVQQAAGGIVIAPSGGEVEHFQFNSSASGNQLNANGHASVGFDVWYDLPNKGREALITATFGFKTTNKASDGTYSSFQNSIDVKVQP